MPAKRRIIPQRKTDHAVLVRLSANTFELLTLEADSQRRSRGQLARIILEDELNRRRAGQLEQENR